MNPPADASWGSKPRRTLRTATTDWSNGMPGASCSGTTSTPPGASCSCQARGTVAVLAVTTTASTGAAAGQPAYPSPTTTSAGESAARRARRASAAAPGSSSTEVTDPPGPTRCARRAAL